jgi:hypothetical protein
MPLPVEPVGPAAHIESADEMRHRAAAIRDHAWLLGEHAAARRFLELAAELEARADTLDADRKSGLAGGPALPVAV